MLENKNFSFTGGFEISEQEIFGQCCKYSDSVGNYQTTLRASNCPNISNPPVLAYKCRGKVICDSLSTEILTNVCKLHELAYRIDSVFISETQ